MRSATAPEIIVAVVPQNPIWKMKKAINQGLEDSLKKKLEVPNNPALEIPNIRPNPNSQNTADETQKSAKFFAATLILFFDLTEPLSRQVKPACINMTKAAHMRSQATSSISLGFDIVFQPVRSVGYLCKSDMETEAAVSPAKVLREKDLEAGILARRPRVPSTTDGVSG